MHAAAASFNEPAQGDLARYESLLTFPGSFFGDFERLRRELDTARIEAAMKDGVLTLRVPKQEHAKPRRIAVHAG